MELVGITTCVNYADYLAWSLPFARNVFDRLLVITDYDDKETKKVCDFWWVECLQTELFYKDGAKFNKGLAIKLGLEYLSPTDSVVHFDSDIVFPPRFSEFIRCKKLNKDFIYGADRLDIKDWDTWISFLSKPFSQHSLGSVWAGFPVMYRCTQSLTYQPIGYFQLWNMRSKYYKGYPESSETAADSDLVFANQWPAENRILIPEFFLYHLNSEPLEIGANWSKRVSKRFGPC